MDAVKPTIILIPALALMLAFFLYWYIKKSTGRQAGFKTFLSWTIFWSLILNFSWEMLQMPLFENMRLDWQSTLFCGLATLADTVMVVLLYLILALAFKDPLWGGQMTGKRIMILVLSGGAGAVLAELRHVSAGNWSYSELMPLLPLVPVGLSPVLQFMILPAICYYLAGRRLKDYPDHQ